MVIIGIFLGTFIFLLYLALYFLLNKAYKINPLLHLGGIYLMIEILDKGVYSIIPENWTIAQIDTPFQMDGTIGFFLRSTEPKMSVYDMAMAVLIIYFLFFFIYNVGIKKYVKRPN